MLVLFLQPKGAGKVNIDWIVNTTVSGGANTKGKAGQRLTLSRKEVKTMGRQIKQVQKALQGFTHRMFIMRLNTRRLLRQLKMLKGEKVFEPYH